MKIGKAYELDEVDPRQFEKLADDIGFTKPLVIRKVIDHTKKMLAQLGNVQIPHANVEVVRKFIGSHFSSVLDRFMNGGSKELVSMQ